MQIVSNGDNLHEMSKSCCLGKNKKITINLPSAEFAHRVVKVKHANDHIWNVLLLPFYNTTIIMIY